MKSLLGVLGAVVVLGLQSCSSVPAMARTSRGEVFEGTASAGSLGGTFSMYGHGGRSMTGSFRAATEAKVGSFKFTVSDGRTGKGTLRHHGEGNGYGVGSFEKGGRCKFMYGDSAIARHRRSGP